MDKEDIEKLEQLGYVADNQKIREELVSLLNNQQADLETIQLQLKQIQKTAKKKGLFTRNQLSKKNITLEQAISIAEKEKIIYAYESMLVKLPKKNKHKRIKI